MQVETHSPNNLRIIISKPETDSKDRGYIIMSDYCLTISGSRAYFPLKDFTENQRKDIAGVLRKMADKFDSGIRD